MILRKKDTHYEVEMFNVVNLSKDHPEKAWEQYLIKITQEFLQELNTSRFAVKNNIPYVPVTSSHHVVLDGAKELKVPGTDIIHTKDI
jgi:hypothetical protein